MNGERQGGLTLVVASCDISQLQDASIDSGQVRRGAKLLLLMLGGGWLLVMVKDVELWDVT